MFLELEKLKAVLRNKGLDEETVESIAAKAEAEIASALKEEMDNALELAVQSGVQKDSPEFINELRPRPDAFILETESGITDFSEPPFPMLDRLLANGAKPMKDGSGVYKVIPVGAPSSKPKTPIYANIFDTQKAISAQRYEESVARYNKIAPKGSKVNFRTATSKQDRNTQWVLPEKEKNFTEDLQEINQMLQQSHEDIVRRVIRSYEENF
ncbi:MAG: hypothetical protein QXG63_06620 [Nitrososphaerales archaeon]